MQISVSAATNQHYVSLVRLKILVTTSTETRCGHKSCLGAEKEGHTMYSILYIIGAIVVIIVVLKVLGLY